MSRQIAEHRRGVLDASGRGVLPLWIALTGDPTKVTTIADLDAA